MRIDIMIEIVVTVAKSTGDSTVNYLSDIAPIDDSMDIYVAEVSKSIALYHHAGYNEARRAMRDARQTISPQHPAEKMILVGQVRRALSFDPATHVEVSRAQLRLKDIPLDEW